MSAVFIQDGDSIDYTPDVDVPARAVIVQGELVGVAKRPIPANTPGSLAVTGIFDFSKATTSGNQIGLGANVYWDATTKGATANATNNKLIGKALKAVASADPTVRVRMSQ